MAGVGVEHQVEVPQADVMTLEIDISRDSVLRTGAYAVCMLYPPSYQFVLRGKGPDWGGYWFTPAFVGSYIEFP